MAQWPFSFIYLCIYFTYLFILYYLDCVKLVQSDMEWGLWYQTLTRQRKIYIYSSVWCHKTSEYFCGLGRKFWVLKEMYAFTVLFYLKRWFLLIFNNIFYIQKYKSNIKKMTHIRLQNKDRMLSVCYEVCIINYGILEKNKNVWGCSMQRSYKHCN